MNECAARNVTCNFCQKIGHFERTCRAKKNHRGQFVYRSYLGASEPGTIRVGGNGRRIIATRKLSGMGKSDRIKAKPIMGFRYNGGGDCMVMAVRIKNHTELRVAEGRNYPSQYTDEKPLCGSTAARRFRYSPLTNFEERWVPQEKNCRRSNRRTKNFGTMGINQLTGNDEGGARIDWLAYFSSDQGNWKNSPIYHRERPDAPLRIAVSSEESGPRSDIDTGDCRGESQLKKWQDYFTVLFSNLFKRVGKIMTKER